MGYSSEHRQEDVKTSDLKVLIVDDDVALRDLLKEVFRKEGYALHFAVDGKEALEQTLSIKPDLILLDILMPKLDGVTFCKALRTHEDTQAIPIIIITAFGSRARLEECMAAGADDFIAKPFDVEDLATRVRVMLESRGTTNQMERLQRYIVALRQKRAEKKLHTKDRPRA